MKKVILVLSIFISTSAFATGGHFHPKKVAKCEPKICSEEQIKAAVPAGVKELANWKKIDAKWETAKIESAVVKEFTKGSKTIKAWVVALIDEKENDSSKNKVYLYFLEDGSIFRTNTTGELK
ncbi:MAG: hypothetical protein K2Q26_16210 [Bdellovibrionales bacterium]|nr:hypothetical protein [Bdellovibrionales bacterium]